MVFVISMVRMARSMASNEGGFGAGRAWSPSAADLLRWSCRVHDPCSFAPADPDAARDADARLCVWAASHPDDLRFVQIGSCAGVVRAHKDLRTSLGWSDIYVATGTKITWMISH